MAEKTSHWKQVHIVFPDGLEIVQVVDQPTIRRIESGDEELLSQIRKNYDELHQSKPIDDTSNVDDADEALHSDIEDVPGTDNQPVLWSREATDLLIALYEEHEEAFEDPRKKKKDVWKLVTARINEAGYKHSQQKVEGKWRSLLASHKDLRLNKSKSGQRRKTFQYFEKIDNILSKRHDINPPFVSGSGLKKSKTSSFSSKTNCNLSVAEEETGSSSLSTEVNNTSTSSSVEIESNADHMEKNTTTTTMSTSASARYRRERRRANDEGNTGISTLIEYLQEMEKERKQERKEREKKRDQHNKEKTDLFREFLQGFKKQ